MLPWLIFLSFIGGLLAYAILIGIVGARRVRSMYQRHELLITRLCGVMFIGFAVNALAHALPGLVTSKA
jgi:threonine/homoserine/homoserine lactone efflux protein